MTRGLPQKDALETVLRDAMAVDAFEPAGIYFGTRSGKLYGSRDEGRSWALLHDGLPPIVCVKAVTVENARGRDASAKRSRVRRPKRGGPPDGRAVPDPGSSAPVLGRRVLGRARRLSGDRRATRIAALGAAHPGLRERILTERGEVRPHVNLFVAETNIRDGGGLAMRVPDGAEIAILPAVSGG